MTGIAGPAVVEGFRSFGGEGFTLLAADEIASDVAVLGLLEPGGLERALARPSGTRGRVDTSVLSLATTGARLHLRPFRHGGWLGGLRSDDLPSLARPIAELRVTAALAAAGAPVPTPALLVAARAGSRWKVALGTLFEEGAIDAADWLRSPWDRSRLLRATAAVAAAVRSFHDAGALHSDLHLGNLLIRERSDATEVVIVDLDRTTRSARVTPAQRMRELMRLHRSLVKRRLVQHVGSRCYARFLESYTGGDRQLREELRAHLARERFRVAVHAAGYWSARRVESIRTRAGDA